MKIKAFIILVLITSTSGCVSFKTLTTENLTKLSDENINQLNGVYLNKSDDTLSDINKSLWEQIDFWNHGPYLEEWKNCFVRTEVLNSHRLKALLLNNGEIIKEISIHGKIKDGYFYKRRIFLILPFFPLIWGYRNHQLRIGLAEDKLIVDNTSFGIGFIILAGGKEKTKRTIKYSRK